MKKTYIKPTARGVELKYGIAEGDGLEINTSKNAPVGGGGEYEDPDVKGEMTDEEGTPWGSTHNLWEDMW